MASGRPDPYSVLGVPPTATDAEVRSAYRRLVQLHHPDHNGGSAESARRFEEVQEAYAGVKAARAGGAGARSARRPPTTPPPRRPSPPPRPTPPRTAPSRGDPTIEARLADLERQVRVEREKAREAARQAAREAAAAARAAAQTGPKRPSDEELGYVTTDDSIAKILADARAQAADRLAEIREPVSRRVADLLDQVASKLGAPEPPDEPQ